MTEQTYVQLIAAVTSFLGLVFTGIIGYFVRKLDLQSRQFGEKAREATNDIRAINVEQNDRIASLADVVGATSEHAATGVSAQLKMYMELANKVAGLPGASPIDKEAAKRASQLYFDHLTKKKMMDELLGQERARYSRTSSFHDLDLPPSRTGLPVDTSRPD